MSEREEGAAPSAEIRSFNTRGATAMRHTKVVNVNAESTPQVVVGHLGLSKPVATIDFAGVTLTGTIDEIREWLGNVGLELARAELDLNDRLDTRTHR